MINKNSLFLSLTALAFCVASAGAQELPFADFNAGSNPTAGSLNGKAKPGAVVGKLPNDYFASTAASDSSGDAELEVSTSHTTANLLVIAALATMLCVGMTITGLCIMRRRPPSTPAQVLAIQQRRLGISH